MLKTLQIKLAVGLTATLLIASCSITKRQHMSGYAVNWKTKQLEDSKERSEKQLAEVTENKTIDSSGINKETEANDPKINNTSIALQQPTTVSPENQQNLEKSTIQEQPSAVQQENVNIDLSKQQNESQTINQEEQKETPKLKLETYSIASFFFTFAGLLLLANLATFGMILSIVIALIFGILGIIYGFKGRRRLKNNDYKYEEVTKILSTLGIVFGFLVTIAAILLPAFVALIFII